MNDNILLARAKSYTDKRMSETGKCNTHLYVGEDGDPANYPDEYENPYLKLVENGVIKSEVQLVGCDGIEVMYDGGSEIGIKGSSPLTLLGSFGEDEGTEEEFTFTFSSVYKYVLVVVDEPYGPNVITSQIFPVKTVDGKMFYDSSLSYDANSTSNHDLGYVNFSAPNAYTTQMYIYINNPDRFRFSVYGIR